MLSFVIPLVHGMLPSWSLVMGKKSDCSSIDPNSHFVYNERSTEFAHTLPAMMSSFQGFHSKHDKSNIDTSATRHILPRPSVLDLSRASDVASACLDRLFMYASNDSHSTRVSPTKTTMTKAVHREKRLLGFD
jgi:hypothetical protein